MYHFTVEKRVGSKKERKPNLYKAVLPEQINQCPFCTEHRQESNIGESLNGTAYWTLNKYPLIPESFASLVINTKKHILDFGDMDTSELKEALDFIRECYYKTRDMGYPTVAVFTNAGPKSGGSIPHTHTQIIGLPIEEICSKHKLCSGIPIIDSDTYSLTVPYLRVTYGHEIVLKSKLDDGSFDLDAIKVLKDLVLAIRLDMGSEEYGVNIVHCIEEGLIRITVSNPGIVSITLFYDIAVQFHLEDSLFYFKEIMSKLEGGYYGRN